MNIEGAKTLPVTSSTAVVKAGAQPLTETSAIPEGFAESLTEQIKLASEAKGLDEVPKPLQQLVSGENLNHLHSLAGLLENPGAAQELAALFGKDLPVSYKIGDQEDIEGTLSTLTEALKRVSSGSPIVQDSQISSGQVIGALAGMDAGVEPGDVQAETQPITDGISISPSEGQSDNPAVSAEAMDVIKAMLGAAFISGQESEIFPENLENRGKSPLTIPLSVANPSAGTIDLKGSDEVGPSGDLSQQDGIFRQIIQGGQEADGLSQSGLAEKMDPARQLAEIDAEVSLPRVAADWMQPNKPRVDGRLDVPVMGKPVGHPQWNQDLGERILWMHNKAMPAAEIKLNPQHLGPISVRIDMSQDQATVTFTAQHAAVREALEASVPRLREMMNAQQINLGDVSVFQNSSEQKQSQSQGYGQTANDWDNSAGRKADDAVIDAEAGSQSVVVSKGLLSIYA